jgi:hypothetical protein
LLIDDIKQEVSEVAYVIVVLHKIDLYINQRTHKKMFEVYIPSKKVIYFFKDVIHDKIFFVKNGFITSYELGFVVNRILFYIAWEKYFNQKIKPLAFKGVQFDSVAN